MADCVPGSERSNLRYMRLFYEHVEIVHALREQSSVPIR